MKNFTIVNFLIIAIALLLPSTLLAQGISVPVLNFSKACASFTANFNAFEIRFAFSAGFDASNVFIVELSDGNGDFLNPTVVYTSNPGSMITSPAIIGFSVPTDASGENYRIRVKSTSPATQSGESVAFPAHYKIQDSPFSINNLIETAIYCQGESYLLTIDNPGGPLNDSPLQYPNLTFEWFRVINETEEVFVASGESLEVTSPGTYFVNTNYGSCAPSASTSNRVIVSEASSGGVSSSVSSSLGNPYCSENGPTILSISGGNTYQWFKDGEEIQGATEQTYKTNEQGRYTVSIELGNCSATASIDLVNTDFITEIDVNETNVLTTGETLTVNVTTTAVNPVYEWYLNETLITGATESSYEVSQIGDYSVVVRQTQGCIGEQELSFKVNEPFPDVPNIPNIVTPNGDGQNDTWVIPQEFVSGTNTQVMILSSLGKVVFNTTDYQNNWPENELNFNDVNSVYYYIIKTPNQKTKKGSITILR